MNQKEFIKSRLRAYSVSVPVVSSLFKLQPHWEYELIDLDKNTITPNTREVLESIGNKVDETKFLHVIPPNDFSKLDDRLLSQSVRKVIDPIDKTEMYEFNDFIYCFYPGYPDSNGSITIIIPWKFAESMIPSGTKVEVGDHVYKTYSKLNTYSWKWLFTAVGMPLITALVQALAGKVKFLIRKDEVEFDALIDKFKKSQSPEESEKYWQRIQYYLNKSKNKSEVAEIVNNVKKSAQPA